MTIPSFSDFLLSFDGNKWDFDVDHICPNALREENNLFTSEQYAVISKMISLIFVSFLQQYHQWLLEKLDE